MSIGTKGAVAASIPLFFSNNVNGAFAEKLSGKAELNNYYSHFGVDEKFIRDIFSVALSRGGDYCDVFFQHQMSNYIGLEDKQVNRAYSNIDFGVGIRVLKGDQTGYSFTEDISPKAVRLAAKTAANIADGSKEVPPVDLAQIETANYYPVKTKWEDVKIDTKIPYLERINEKIFAMDKRVIKSNIWFIDQSAYNLVASSDGIITCDYQPMTLAYVSCTAEEKGKKESNSFSLAIRDGIEYFTDDVVNRLASETVKSTVSLFNAVKPKGGEMEVVLAAGSSGILLHEAIGHGMEADFNRKKVSIFSDKIGKPVAEKFVSIVDDGTNPQVRGSINIDDENMKSQKTYLVENGTLRSYMHDRISAKFYKVKPTGNGRRQSFRFAPMPRMRNTYMLPGPHKKEEIIKSVKHGIYAETFTNGEVYIGAGDFTFYVKSGFLIEDGKLTKPVKDINIIGNGPEVLKNINMVADDFKMAEGGWTCGKNGQGVPVSMGLPTVKVSSITVGGVR
ncbi:MAG: metallopeptidase TldD-related protein [Acidobacteriota bacterium]